MAQARPSRWCTRCREGMADTATERRGRSRWSSCHNEWAHVASARADAVATQLGEHGREMPAIGARQRSRRAPRAHRARNAREAGGAAGRGLVGSALARRALHRAFSRGDVAGRACSTRPVGCGAEQLALCPHRARYTSRVARGAESTTVGASAASDEGRARSGTRRGAVACDRQGLST